MASRLRMLGPPIVTSLNGASTGVIDMGGTVPEEIIVQACLDTNSGYELAITVSDASDASSTILSKAANAHGAVFTNQPNNDSIEVLSSSQLDFGAKVTLYGNKNGAVTTYYKETVTLEGKTAVATATYTDWADLLGVEMDRACVGTVTIREASGNATITTIPPGSTSSGIYYITREEPAHFGLPAAMVSEAGVTTHAGYVGLTTSGETAEVGALNATTNVTGTLPWKRLTKLLVGDVAADKLITLKRSSVTKSSAMAVITDLGADDAGAGRNLPAGKRYLHWTLYNGTTATNGGADDKVIIRCFG